MTSLDKYAVPPERLRLTQDPAALGFECTEQLQPLQSFIGQPRALKSLEFALEVDKPGYNVFVTGLTGTGRTSAVKTYIQRRVQGDGLYPVFDWCYAFNFKEPDRPQALRFARGVGRRFRDRVEGLLKEGREALPKAFANEDYVAQRKRILEEGQAQNQQAMSGLQREARQRGFDLQFGPAGVTIIPLWEGRPLTQEEFMALSPQSRESMDAERARILQQVEEASQRLRVTAQEVSKRVQELDRKVGEYSLSQVFKDEMEEFKESPEAVKFLEDLKAYTLDHLELFRAQEGQSPDEQPPTDGAGPRPRDPFLPFRVNLFVDNADSAGPPIVVESNPIWTNMFGRIERRAVMGAYFSDHTMLKPGAIHAANGGFLVVNAQELLAAPGVWQGVKRVIRTKEVRLEDPTEQFGWMVPQGLRPEPIPVELKLVIVGDENLYRMLSMYDREDFWEMFKVKAEFDYEIARSPDNVDAYASFICGTCSAEKLRHFDKTAVAKVLEQGSRMVEDQERLSSRFGQIKDLLIESDYWARKAGATRVSAGHVQKAIQEKVYRLNLIEERLRRMIEEGTLMMDLKGAVVGQINGLVVYDLGDFRFGRPTRITAKTFAGRRGVVNIEREIAMSGPIHNKGVLILGGYLGYKYGQEAPLSLSASITFEQSYEGVEGDSASSTELYAILSSLSGLPLRQDIAVTGSVNQKGEVQPIGGVNQKVEGFFDVCRATGLTGTQGVLVPKTNLRNLMLREDVVDAVREGKFHVYCAGTIDDGIEVLTGRRAGQRRADGTYPRGTVNALVQKRLLEMGESLRGYYAALLDEKG